MALDKLNMDFKNKGEPNAIPINSTNLNKITKKIDEIIDKLYPIGTYYMTSDDNFNPNITWGGTWVKEEDGTVLSSKSTEVGSLLNADTGSIVGEDKHTMTVDELASHDHEYNGWSYQINVGTSGVYALVSLIMLIITFRKVVIKQLLNQQVQQLLSILSKKQKSSIFGIGRLNGNNFSTVYFS